MRLSEMNYKNPVLKGQYADPDLAFFDGKWYIYPTTDGFDGWSGTQFFVFESKDGVNFENKGLIVDVASDQVPWSIGSAWAPCITKRNDKYYFYFCAKDVTGVSGVGVAIADSPVGPFKAFDKPVLCQEIMKKNNINVGQVIDPSIFKEDDNYYIVFGNGSPVIAKLNEDMTSIDESTLQKLEGAFDFRESMIVTKYNGLYHYTWSVDDTGSENYHINYGVSKNLYGPIEYKYTVLEKDPSRDILGTGHHSILEYEPGKFRIAYHRFVTPLGQYTKGFGFHRETCLADLDFDENGLMKKVEMKN